MKLKVPATCEECIKNGTNNLIKEKVGVKYCPYEFLTYVVKTIDFFKKEFNMDIPQLQQMVPAIDAKAKQCLQNIGNEIEKKNEEIRRVEQMREQLGITDFMKSMQQLKEYMETMSESIHRLAKTNEVILKNTLTNEKSIDIESEETPKEKEEIKSKTIPIAMNIKKRKVDAKIQQFLNDHEDASRDDIEAFKNKSGKYTIIYRKPS